MSDDETVEGGLDEPTELEPDQGALDLAQPEDDHTRADWEAATAAVLRKTKRLTDDDPDDLVWDKLTKRTLDGIDVTPLGTPDMLGAAQTSGRPTRQGAWDIRGHFARSSTDKADKAVNDEVMADLEGGVASLWLDVTTDTDFNVLLDEVLLDLAPVVLSAPADDQVAVAKAYWEHIKDREVHPGTNLGVDADGVSSNDFADVAALANRAGILGFVVDATTVHDRGASDAQEIGYAMETAAGYLRVAEQAGLSVAEAAKLVEFRLAATDEQFPTIAKLRAVRRLWARVLELSGVTDEIAMRLHAVTSRPMMSTYDPWVNMLRTTVASFAAGVGGADAVTVLPFDSPLGRPDAFGRRIARNTSHLLIDESHVAKVTDPAGGSYAVEKLTDDLAAAGWEVFGQLDSGTDIDGLIADVVAERDRQVAKRSRPLTGISEFPNLDESLPEREAYDAWQGVRPYGAAFEAMREAPAEKPVFLATLGTVAAHTARATFASNLLAAGGIAVESAGATSGVEELVKAYDGQTVVCLAGADPTYEEWGADAAAALREAGAAKIIIAGKATDYTDDACGMGIDAVEFLTRTRESLS